MKLHSLNTIRRFVRRHPITTAAKVSSMSAGLAGIGIALYDAHHWGNLRAYQDKNDANANAGLNYFRNTLYLDNKSYFTSRLKQSYLDCELSTSIRGTGAGISGYNKGFMIGLMRHSVPLVASIAAITLKGKKSLIGLAGLALWGMYATSKHSLSHLDHKL